MIDAMAERSQGNGFLSGLLNAQNTAVIGYSMGGYGALNSAGAGYSEAAASFPGLPEGALEPRVTGNFKPDPRIKAVVAFAPWGAEAALGRFIGIPDLSFFEPDGLAGLRVPTFFVVGSQDDVSGYEGGVKSLFEGAVNAGQVHARLRRCPPQRRAEPAAGRRAESWTSIRATPSFPGTRGEINNVNQHFVTAFLDGTLKGKKTGQYLELIQNSNEGVWAQNEDGSFSPEHTYWTGFQERTALGYAVLSRVCG